MIRVYTDLYICISELTEATILKFSKSTYNGQLYNGELTVEDIILESGYTPQITFTLNGGTYYINKDSKKESIVIQYNTLF